MSPVTPIGGGEGRRFSDVYDDLDAALHDIHITAELISSADGAIDCSTMNRAGYMLDRLAMRARSLLNELHSVQKRPT